MRRKHEEGKGRSVLSTDDITPTQGFACAWFGRLTRSLGSGGRRGADGVLVGFGGIS